MVRRFHALPLAVLALAPAVLAQQFTYNPAALPANSLWTDGVSISDVDGDGDMDIAFANSGNSGYAAGSTAAQDLLLNDGTGIFSAAPHTMWGLTGVGTRMVISEDIDNDGDNDLLFARDSGWPNPTQPPIVMINNGSGTFTNETATRIPAGFFMTGFCICAGDVDDDGSLDLVVTNGGTQGGVATQARLLMNDGTGHFTDGTAARMPVDLYNAQDVTLLDVDNDMDVDICLGGKGSATLHARLYLNDGTGHFTISNALNLVGTSGTYEIDYADLDGDGDFDAAVQSIASFNEGWARNDGPNTAWVKTTITGPNQDDNEMACFDYDVDGDMDIFTGSLGASERVYNNNGSGGFTIANGVIQAISDSTLDFGIGDLNNDGRYDLVTGQGESGSFTNKVYMNNGPVDTRAPVFMRVDTPSSVGASSTVFHAQIEDQFADDGHIPATASFAYTTDVGSGSGNGHPMGNGLFRAEVPTAGATTVSLTWTATDAHGNVSTDGPIVVVGGGSPWTDLGRALAGVSGNPVLTGNGTLVAGSSGSLALTNAAPSAACLMFVSLSSSPVPFKGGTLCAFPFTVTLPLSTDGAGSVTLPWASWPSGLSGLSLFFQDAIADGAAIHGASLSNAEQGNVP